MYVTVDQVRSLFDLEEFIEDGEANVVELAENIADAFDAYANSYEREVPAYIFDMATDLLAEVA